MDKNELRLIAKQKRIILNTELLSEKLLEKLKDSSAYKKSHSIMIFYPLKHEVNLLGLLTDKSKTFYLPKIDGNNLICCPYTQGNKLIKSCFNTNEPICPPIDKSNIDLIVVPALCCDINNYRLGYGGGYYDRLLANYKGISVTCISKELIVESVFPEIYDVPVNFVISV